FTPMFVGASSSCLDLHQIERAPGRWTEADDARPALRWKLSVESACSGLACTGRASVKPEGARATSGSMHAHHDSQRRPSADRVPGHAPPPFIFLVGRYPTSNTGVDFEAADLYNCSRTYKVGGSRSCVPRTAATLQDGSAILTQNTCWPAGSTA